MGLNLKHQQRDRTVIQHVVDPSQALTSLLDENEQLKSQVTQMFQEQSRLGSQLEQELQSSANLKQFEQIVMNKIPALTVTLKDEYIIGQLRAMMVRIWGPGGELDADGKWTQTVVHRRLELLLTELIRYSRDHFHNIVGRVKLAEGVVPDGTAG